MAWRRKQPDGGMGDFAPIVAVIAAGLVLSAMLFFVARSYYAAADRDQFQRDAAFYGATFRSSMERHVNSLAAIHAFVTASHDLNRWEFSNFAHQILPQNSGFKAVLWLPDVSAQERAGFEAELQRDGLFGLTLRELTDTGQLIGAHARDEYIPVAYVEPFEASGNLIGVDLAHDPIYGPLFEAARKAGKVVASPPLDRALVDGKPPLVVLAFPLNRDTVAKAVSTGTVSAGKSGLARAASPNTLEGYALGVVQLDRVVDAAIGARAPVQAVIAYGSRNDPAIFGGGQGETLARWYRGHEFHQLEPFRVAGQSFFLAIRSAQGGSLLTRLYVPAGAALFGLLLTALLTQSMLATTMRKRQVEGAVVARTAELSRSNESLNAEIAQRREAERALIAARDRAEAANRAKSAFLSTMSHELRTPLNAIIGFSSMLLAKADGGGTRTEDYLTEINGAGSRLLSLINDILEITQMDTETQEPGDIVYLRDIVDAVIEKLREQADAAGVALQAAVSDRLPALRGDARRLKRALEHLAGNAIKFGGKGGFVVIGARIGEGTVVLEVSDNGPGLKPGTEEAAMSLFAQADSSHARHHDGVGLGLTFVARVAAQHGAQLKISSRPGEGTRVALVFPQARIAHANQDKPREVA